MQERRRTRREEREAVRGCWKIPKELSRARRVETECGYGGRRQDEGGRKLGWKQRAYDVHQAPASPAEAALCRMPKGVAAVRRRLNAYQVLTEIPASYVPNDT